MKEELRQYYSMSYWLKQATSVILSVIVLLLNGKNNKKHTRQPSHDVKLYFQVIISFINIATEVHYLGDNNN